MLTSGTCPIERQEPLEDGVAGYARGDDPTTLVSRADAALYAAKAAGRNRVERGHRGPQEPG
jgi:GGDEF domain-containing protein